MSKPKLIFGEDIRVTLTDEQNGLAGWVFINRRHIVSINFSVPHLTAIVETTSSLLSGQDQLRWIGKEKIANKQIVPIENAFERIKMFALTSEPIATTIRDEDHVLELWNYKHGTADTKETCELFKAHREMMEKLEKEKQEAIKREEAKKSGLVKADGETPLNENTVGKIIIPGQED